MRPPWTLCRWCGAAIASFMAKNHTVHLKSAIGVVDGRSQSTIAAEVNGGIANDIRLWLVDFLAKGNDSAIGWHYASEKEEVAKMRLVDADKQLEWVDCMKPIHGIGLEPVVAVETVRDLVIGSPTIDAIPVEWLKEQITEAPDSLWASLIKMVMNQWQKEQEKHGI